MLLLKNALDRWITLLNRAGEFTSDNLPKELATEDFKKAVNELNRMQFNEIEKL